jgi:hypothetical protein
VLLKTMARAFLPSASLSEFVQTSVNLARNSAKLDPGVALHERLVDRTRPLCPYPAYEVYKGEGSTDVAANFECHEPAQVPNYFVLGGLEMDDVWPALTR